MQENDVVYCIHCLERTGDAPAELEKHGLGRCSERCPTCRQVAPGQLNGSCPNCGTEIAYD